MATTKTLTTLAQALPLEEFAEYHTTVVSARPEAVWTALHETRWGDLTVTIPLVMVRGLGRLSTRHSPRLLDPSGPVRVLLSELPAYVAGGRIAKPWKPRPDRGPDVDTLAELAAYDEPGWVKYGMDFALTPLPGGRTRVTTTTLCQPTDDSARHAFAPYWRLIRPFSALIRVDMLRAIGARAEAGERAALA